MLTTKSSPAEFVYKITDHVCRVCFGRVLVRITVDYRKIYRCSCCGVEREGKTEAAICTCGVKLRNKTDLGIRCMVNTQRTPECPSEIVAEQIADLALKPVPQKKLPEDDTDFD